MKWKKHGLVFCPKHEANWMVSHAANPVPYILDETKGLVRVLFTCRNEINQSYIGFCDVKIKGASSEVINLSKKPVLSPGQPGLFDDSGVAMGYLLGVNDNLKITEKQELYLFYLGWNLKVTVPWLNTIGLAKGNFETGFKKTSLAPLMDRSNEDPYSISYPCIIHHDGEYKMWYGSNLGWGSDQSQMKHVIKLATSKDLIQWKRSNEISVGLQHQNEYALSKPWVFKHNDDFLMLYSFRANEKIDTYRIGMAISNDAKKWKRIDNEVGIDVSKTGWDSKMICYPSVFHMCDVTYMLYNGNGYGKTGFGLASLVYS